MDRAVGSWECSKNVLSQLARALVYGRVRRAQGGSPHSRTPFALEGAKQGPRAITIVPGGIESGITSITVQNLPADTDWSLFGNLQAQLRNGRPGTPAGIAGVIAMLISGDGAFITGTEIRIDDGAHM